MALPALTAAAGAWLWESFGDDIKSTVKGAAKQAWTGVNWFVAAKRYRENLYEQYKEIQIFGQPEPVPLEGIFTHVNILDRPSALERYDITALREAIREDPSRFHEVERLFAQSGAERIDGWKLVRQPDNNHLFILGKPGAGKTTFLKYLALQAVQGKLDAIPIFVSLKEWADSNLGLLPFLSSRFDICDFPNAEPFVEFILREGKALVLFDGLDEVGREMRERMRLIPTLIDFCTKHRKNQCLLTCRTASTDYTFEGFKYVEVADFNEDQMHIFVRKWFKSNADIGNKFWKEFKRKENRGLRELGRIPLLLTLLCLAFQETLTFPRRRVEIYEEALDALLKKWDSSRKIARDVLYHKLSLGRKRQMFARIAAETFDQGDYFFRQDDLERRIVDYLRLLPPAGQEKDIDSTAVLKAIEAQHGIFVERAHQIYAFAHLTFQEYFTAKYVVDNVGEGTIPRLLSHCTDDRWREAILLTASLLDKADDFFIKFRRIIDNLIAGDEKLPDFIRWATDKAASVQTDYEPAAVRSFYCYLDLYHFNRVPDRNRVLDLALDLTRVLDPGLARAGDLDLDLDLDLARVLQHAHPGSGDFDLALVRVLSRDRALNRNPHLHQALIALQIPSRSRSENWPNFVKELQSIMITHRNIGHKRDFTKQQIECLTSYFQANRLLVECLNLAYVSNRDVIENSLLLPPKSYTSS